VTEQHPDRRERGSTAKAARKEERRRASRRRRLALVMRGLALVAVVAVATTYAVRSEQDKSASGGTIAFNSQTRTLRFDLPSFDGGRLRSADLRGRPTVVNFYASWCPTCEAELPDFEQVHQSTKGRVNVIGVNPQSNDTDRRQAEMITRSAVTFPTGRDVGDKLLRTFNLTGALPTTVFLDAGGRVVDVHNGQLLAPQLTEKLSRLFGVTV